MGNHFFNTGRERVYTLSLQLSIFKLIRNNKLNEFLFFRICVSDDGEWFATCSNDSSLKLWEGARLESRSVNNRSRATYSKLGGQVKCLTFCQQTHSIAAASDNGSVQVLE